MTNEQTEAAARQYCILMGWDPDTIADITDVFGSPSVTEKGPLWLGYARSQKWKDAVSDAMMAVAIRKALESSEGVSEGRKKFPAKPLVERELSILEMLLDTVGATGAGPDREAAIADYRAFLEIVRSRERVIELAPLLEGRGLNRG